jgi:hypothetical protein
MASIIRIAGLRRVVWLALAAMLFSAISPAIAGLALRGHAGALAQMLGIPAQSAMHHDVGCPHGAASEEHQSQSSGPAGSHHGSHGIYCSLCLNPGSIAAIGIPACSTAVLTLAFELLATELRADPVSSFVAAYRSRGPPHTSPSVSP